MQFINKSNAGGWTWCWPSYGNKIIKTREVYSYKETLTDFS